MKVHLIGAGGFIGRALSRRLLEHGHEATGVDLRPSQPGDAFEIKACDVSRDPIDIPAGRDLVVYLAQSPHYRQPKGRLDHLFAVNVAGALRAAEAAAESNAGHFLYCSTGNVYDHSFEPMREAAPVRRDNPYSLSKLAAEEALDLVQADMPITRARLFGVFGPGQQRNLVSQIHQRVMKGAPVELRPREITSDSPETPDAVATATSVETEFGLRISLTFVIDLAEIVIRLAERALAGTDLPPIINIAGDEAVSLRRLADVIGHATGRSPQFEIGETPRDTDFIADIARLRALIQPSFTPLEDAIARTFPIGA